MTDSYGGSAGTASAMYRVPDQPHRWQQDDRDDYGQRPLCRQCRRERAEGDHTREGQR